MVAPAGDRPDPVPDPRPPLLPAALAWRLSRQVGIRTVLCNIRTPRMDAITEGWIGDAAANS
jgi:hypothetical protein